MKHPLYNVLCRELRRMTSRRLYFGVCLVLPLFCLFFMATIFGSGQMENIPIGIVDQDNIPANSAKHFRCTNLQSNPALHR